MSLVDSGLEPCVFIFVAAKSCGVALKVPHFTAAFVLDEGRSMRLGNQVSHQLVSGGPRRSV